MRKYGVRPNRVLRVALLVSAVFHLSTVTLFSIYVWVPVRRVPYYTFDIVDPRTHASVIRVPRNELRVPTFEDAFQPKPAPDLSTNFETLTLDSPPPLLYELPEVTMPTLEIAELERLQLRERSLQIRSEFEMPTGRDSWARFGQEVGKLQDALRRLTSISPFEREEEAPGPQVIAHPIEGIAMYIEWLGAPDERELLFSPPVPALWDVAPEDIASPLTFPFKVNAKGEVVEVLAPIEDPKGIAGEVAKALINYRFAPLDDETAADQYGTLLIAPDEELMP